LRELFECCCQERLGAAAPFQAVLRPPAQPQSYSLRAGTHALMRSAEVMRMKAVLHIIGVIFIVAWLVLWLAVKITVAAVHLLLLLGIVLIVFALVRASKGTTAA
jgi:Flp pilus assembly protein TadB